MRENTRSYILDFLECMRHPEGETPSFERLLTFEDVVADIDNRRIGSDIIKLFQQADLDHRSLNAWYAMIGLFADVLFDKKKLGRRPKWPRPTKQTLQRDFERCVRAYPKRSGQRLCEALKVEFPRRYSEIPATTILRWVSDERISITKLKNKLKRQATTAKVRRNSGRSFA